VSPGRLRICSLDGVEGEEALHNILDLVALDGLGLLMSTITARTRWTDALSPDDDVKEGEEAERA